VSAVALAGCLAEADLPPGVLNLVTGPGPVVGDEIARNPGTDAVAFIGSTATGRSVASAAAGKATLLEMGGNGPLVVLADADLDRAVEGALQACFLCAGQSCTAGERLLVHHAVRDDFADRLARGGQGPDPARRSARRRHHDGPAEQRGGRRQDGRARRRRAPPRGHGADRRRPRHRLRHRPLLAGDRAHRRAGRRRGRDRGDVRPDRADRRHRLAWTRRSS
jgi:hypothetical protein